MATNRTGSKANYTEIKEKDIRTGVSGYEHKREGHAKQKGEDKARL